MDQSRRQNMRMVFVLMVSAILCAIATFVAIAVVIERSNMTQTPAVDGPVVVNVAGKAIVLYPDPDKTILLASEVGSGVAPETEATPQPTMEVVATADILATEMAMVQLSPTPLPPPPTPVPPDVIFVTYVVEAGDSLYRITQKQNTSIDLMALHSIDSTDIWAGNVLSLPIANPAYCPGMRAHVVRDQQTVYSIARTYGSTTEAIAAVNNLDANYTVKTTQVICIP